MNNYTIYLTKITQDIIDSFSVNKLNSIVLVLKFTVLYIVFRNDTKPCYLNKFICQIKHLHFDFSKLYLPFHYLFRSETMQIVCPFNLESRFGLF